MIRINKDRLAKMFNQHDNMSELILKLSIAGVDKTKLKRKLEDEAYVNALCNSILNLDNMWDLASTNSMSIDRTLFKKSVMKLKDLKKHNAISDIGIELFISLMETAMFNGQEWEHWITTDRQFCFKTLGELALALDADENYSEYKTNK